MINKTLFIFALFISLIASTPAMSCETIFVGTVHTEKELLLLDQLQELVDRDKIILMIEGKTYDLRDATKVGKGSEDSLFGVEDQIAYELQVAAFSFRSLRLAARLNMQVENGTKSHSDLSYMANLSNRYRWQLFSVLTREDIIWNHFLQRTEKLPRLYDLFSRYGIVDAISSGQRIRKEELDSEFLSKLKTDSKKLVEGDPEEIQLLKEWLHLCGVILVITRDQILDLPPEIEPLVDIQAILANEQDKTFKETTLVLGAYRDTFSSKNIRQVVALNLTKKPVVVVMGLTHALRLKHMVEFNQLFGDQLLDQLRPKTVEELTPDVENQMDRALKYIKEHYGQE